MVSTLSTGFLVASPSLLDPNFTRTVVLLVQHQDAGSFGFVVNRPAPVSFQDVADELGLSEDGGAVPEVPVLSGGPVAPDTGWLVFDAVGDEIDLPDDSLLKVTDDLFVSTSLELLSLLANSDDQRTRRHLLVLGYAGWAPGQLEDEIREGTWIPVDLDAGVLFDTEFDDRWAAALGIAGINPMHIVGMPPVEA